jgi:POT family proton-dependent oligopeptide transporter
MTMTQHHPRGLRVLFFTEMWERFGFYTLIAVFVLFMDKEFGWEDRLKADIYGAFLFLVYFFPILGGWLGDRFLGRRKTVLLGAACMALGYVGLTVASPERVHFFFGGLFFIAFGTGILKANMSVLLGNLYGHGNPLKDAGFNIYYMGVNLGAAIAPLAATAISILYGSYRVSFAAAGVGVLVAIVTFLVGRRTLDSADHRPDRGTLRDTTAPSSAGEPSDDRARIITLAILFSIVIFFWIAFYQNGFALTLFAERATLRSDLLRPETYQFFNPFFILLLTPLILKVFGRMRERGGEPSSATKIFWGMFLSGFAMIIMVIASLAGGNLDQNIMSPAWLIGSYFMVTLAEILVSPMGQSFVSRVAPQRMQGLMMGFWFGATAVGGYGSGLLGRFYGLLEHHSYYLIIAGLLFLSSGLVFLVLKRLNRYTQ